MRRSIIGCLILVPALLGGAAQAFPTGAPPPFKDHLLEMALQEVPPLETHAEVCWPATKYAYFPYVAEGLPDGELLGPNWAHFRVSVNVCYTTATDGTRTITSVTGSASGEGGSPELEYTGHTVTDGPGQNGSCGYFKAEGHFENSQTSVEVWSPELRAERCV